MPTAAEVTLTFTVQFVPWVTVPPEKLRLVSPGPGEGENAPAGQVVPALGVDATCKPAGKLSVNATPVRSTVALGFVTVKVIVEVPFSEMLVGEKSLLMVGGDTTVMTSFDVFPGPASEFTETLLFFTPAVVPVTDTDTVQGGPGARLPPDKLTLLPPSAAVAEPRQVALKLPGVATTRPAGKLSVNAIPVTVRLALVLLIVNVRLVVPFSGTVAAPNAFAIDGGLITVRVSEDVLPLPWSLESMVTLLLYTPSSVPCTSTVMVHVKVGPAGSAGLEKLIVPLPAVAVTDPPQLLTTLGVVATTRFAVRLFDGRVSVKLASIVTALELVMLNVIVLGAFTATVVGLKLFVIEGGVPHAVATTPSKNAATAAALQPLHHCTFNAWITSFNLRFPPCWWHRGILCLW